MGNTYGNNVELTTSYAALEDEPGTACARLTIRNFNGNDIVYFSGNGTDDAGFLNAGEAKTFYNTRTPAVYVKGTAADVLYWDADGGI